MNANVLSTKTEAELTLAKAYASAKPKLPGDRKVQAMREAAFRHFDAQGLPHRRIEEWKYTDLRALMRDAKPLALAPSAIIQDRAFYMPTTPAKHSADMDARRLVFVDGAFIAESFRSLRPRTGAQHPFDGSRHSPQAIR